MNKTIDIASTKFDGANALRLYLHYDKGDGWKRQRGYYLSVRPVEVREEVVNGYRMHSIGFTAVEDRARTFFLEECARFNKKIFDRISEKIESNKEKILESWELGEYAAVWMYV